MKRFLTAIVVAFGLTAASISVAQTTDQIMARRTKYFRQCMKTGDAALGVTGGILECNSKETARQNARLNQLYTAIMARSNPRQKAKLRTLERRWIVERGAYCQREADADGGGSLATIVYSYCFLDETIKRTIWLESYKG